MSGKESDIRDDDIFMHSVGLTLLVSIDGHFPEPYTVERATIEVPRFLMLYEKKNFKRPRFVSLSIYLCIQKVFSFCYG
ncbi:MAG: hypothetical protein K2M83_03040 [Muribaculaceae bacterium]|nr:hypothetical protein [Muribaculaceae bacterium]